jgi:hypothetical protein
VFVAEPLDFVEKRLFSATINFWVEDFEFVFKFSLNFDRWRGRQGLVWDFAWRVRLKHEDVIDGMDVAHCCWETEGEWLRTRLSNDFKRAEVFLRELWQWPCGFEELGLDEDSVADLEVQRWHLAVVSRSLITLLSKPDIFFEIFVELWEIDCKLMSMGRSKEMFQIDGDVQMIAFVGKEWGDPSGGT